MPTITRKAGRLRRCPPTFYGMYNTHFAVVARHLFHDGKPLTLAQLGYILETDPASGTSLGDATRKGNTTATTKAEGWQQIAEYVVADLMDQDALDGDMTNGWVLTRRNVTRDGEPAPVPSKKELAELERSKAETTAQENEGARLSTNPFVTEWRSNLPSRPITQEDVEALAAILRGQPGREHDGDIVLRAKILMDEDGAIIDGHLRAAALEFLGINWRTAHYVEYRTYGRGKEANLQRIYDAVDVNLVQRRLTKPTLMKMAEWLDVPDAVEYLAHHFPSRQELWEQMRKRAIELAQEEAPRRKGPGRPTSAGLSQQAIADRLAEEFGEEVTQKSVSNWLADADIRTSSNIPTRTNTQADEEPKPQKNRGGAKTPVKVQRKIQTLAAEGLSSADIAKQLGPVAKGGGPNTIERYKEAEPVDAEVAKKRNKKDHERLVREGTAFLDAISDDPEWADLSTCIGKLRSRLENLA